MRFITTSGGQIHCFHWRHSVMAIALLVQSFGFGVIFCRNLDYWQKQKYLLKVIPSMVSSRQQGMPPAYCRA